MKKGYISYPKTKDYKEGDILKDDRIYVCRNVEDSFSYIEEYEYFNKPEKQALVSVLGDISKYNDKIIITNEIKIDKILSHDDLINILLNDDVEDYRINKFLKNFQLNEEQRSRFIKRSYNSYLAVRYYQDCEIDIYQREKDNPDKYIYEYNKVFKEEVEKDKILSKNKNR